MASPDSHQRCSREPRARGAARLGQGNRDTRHGNREASRDTSLGERRNQRSGALEEVRPVAPLSQPSNANCRGSPEYRGPLLVPRLNPYHRTNGVSQA